MCKSLDSGLRRNDYGGIPAFSGMTAGRQIDFSNPLPSGLPPGDPWPSLMRGPCRLCLAALFDLPLLFSILLHRHSGLPAVGRRRPESRRTRPGCWVVYRLRPLVPDQRHEVLGCHSRWRGNGLHKPLDSGLRRNDGKGIPAFAGITTERGSGLNRNDDGGDRLILVIPYPPVCRLVTVLRPCARLLPCRFKRRRWRPCRSVISFP